MAKTHSGSIRCEVWLEQLNDLTQGAADAERRAQAAEKRNTEYSQEIADLRADYEKSDAALTLMLKHYKAAEATAKEERVRASELAQQLEDAKQNLHGKDRIIANLLDANERLRSALGSAEVKASKAEREVSRLEDVVERLAAPGRVVEEDIECWVEDLDFKEASEVEEEEFMTDCDSDSDWEPGCD